METKARARVELAVWPGGIACRVGPGHEGERASRKALSAVIHIGAGIFLAKHISERQTLDKASAWAVKRHDDVGVVGEGMFDIGVDDAGNRIGVAFCDLPGEPYDQLLLPVNPEHLVRDVRRKTGHGGSQQKSCGDEKAHDPSSRFPFR